MTLVIGGAGDQITFLDIQLEHRIVKGVEEDSRALMGMIKAFEYMAGVNSKKCRLMYKRHTNKILTGLLM